MFGLVGPRGVGKTTMVLQYIKQHLSLADTLYITMDHLYFSAHTLIEVADKFYKQDGKHLFIDEVHKAKDCSLQIKQMVDTYNDKSCSPVHLYWIYIAAWQTSAAVLPSMKCRDLVSASI